ncbi:MAG: LTA synthase family protein [Bacteroidota bacterium]
MKHLLNLIARLLLFWILFFFIQRLIFLGINFDSDAYTLREFWLCQLKALPMDIAAACYLLAIPALAIITGMFINREVLINTIIRIETLVMIVLCSVIGSGDAGLFKVWGTKINSKALSYFAYPDEVLPTVMAWENIGLFLIITAQIIVFYQLAKKLIIPFEKFLMPVWQKGIVSLVMLGLVLVGIRGGIQPVPINRNWVFFSKHTVLNFAALNGFWNMAELAARPLEPRENPYQYFKDEDAERLLKQLHNTPSDSSETILTTTRPNIVIIFLESWAGDVIGCLDGEKGVAPKFDELAKEGILFNHFYSTGFRTEQGMLAVLSAYPAQPISSIIQDFGKFTKLPNLYHVMNEQGYQTSFYTGGRLQFDNIEAYLHAAGVQTMVGETQFPIQKRTLWGAYDDETFAMHLMALNQTQQPFFSALTTMTTHEWYDADVPRYFSGDADQVNDKYRNTMHYADSCLYTYIKQAQQQPWYQNTLFVLVADHSCKFPKGRNNFEVKRHHIPMVLMGGALKKEYAGTVNTRVASHLDIAASLLAQMKLPAANFPRSKNMFNKYAPAFAYYAFDNGFGMITADKQVIFDHNQQKDVLEPIPSDTLALRLQNWGKAFLQTNFQENLNYSARKKTLYP